MQLEQYISDLLYRYDCVTVPEFGSFLTQRQSAQVHDSTNAFYAPTKSLAFNEQIQTNDGLLARYIADVEKISFETALQNLSKHVRTLRSYLSEGKTLNFENIGDLVYNQEGKIEFSPSYHINYLTDAFGLSQFVSPAITRDVIQPKEEVEVITEETIEKVIPITETIEERNSKPYLKYAAVAVIALGISGLGFNNYLNTVNQHNQIAQEEANTKLDSQIQEATFVINNPLPAITLQVNKQSGQYHIVAGAFREEKNSDKKVAQLQDEGFKARKIGKNRHGLHQVAYASYTSREDAFEALNTIRAEQNKDAWLLIKAID
ncbi:SPOR domain-containing protein [Olleya aquimaris]|uniref:SPOR domain-containing protein n=1 Tax=Olleya sediminilitoris TaxID=2795739 RepID=A0ABS1WHG0_9FLAO|nr:SPOR domain-containing protein [Olleya sediminilitoris]AXO80832.1 SPOR domain-containing protein [Olleya aquimaris]MBL7558565.1 SPOR domain-containing protein [Olleya sediminilitoris]